MLFNNLFGNKHYNSSAIPEIIWFKCNDYDKLYNQRSAVFHQIWVKLKTHHENSEDTNAAWRQYLEQLQEKRNTDEAGPWGTWRKAHEPYRRI